MNCPSRLFYYTVGEHLGAPAVYLQTRQSRSSLREAYHNCSPREHHHLPDRAIIVAAAQFITFVADEIITRRSLS